MQSEHLEMIDNLAEKALESLWVEEGRSSPIYIEDDNGDVILSDEAQVIYEELFEEYERELITKNIIKP